MRRRIKKSIIAIIVFFILCVSLTACHASFEGTDTALKDDKIKADFTHIEGEENLYYNNDTHIVYWIGGSYSVNTIGDDYTTSYMTAFYAPNGMPYIYDEESRKMEMIE